MKLIKTLLLPVLFVAMWSLTGCNEEPTTSVTADTTPGLSKLTLPEGAVISSATFNIYVEDAQPVPQSIGVHKVNVTWDEATETFTTFTGKPSPQFKNVAEDNFTANAGWNSADITALVQSWIAGTSFNNGVLLYQANVADGLIGFRSKEYNGGGVSDPFLEVTYTVNGGSPITVQEPAFADTWISNQTAGSNYGGDEFLLVGRLLENYEKYTLIKFDIESTPALCFQEETAWAANGNEPLKLRYTNRGNWATYVQYAEKTVNIYAGRTNFAGTAEFSAVVAGQVTITISLEDGWELNPDEGSETVKIQGYNSAPSGNPAPGRFNTYKGNSLTVTVPAFNFYGIHLDVRKPINCP
jgi:hypothetical protein